MQKVISSSPSLCGTVEKKMSKREQMEEAYNSSRGRKKGREKTIGEVQRKESSEMKEAPMRAHHIWDRIPEPQNEKTLRMSK